jgi:hypothetical protein
MEIELIKQIKELKEYLAMYAPTKEVEQSLLAEGTKKILEKPQIPKDILEVIDKSCFCKQPLAASAGTPEKKKYTYPKEKIQEYTRRHYEKNKEKIIARSTAFLKDKYKTDPKYREKQKEYSKAYRDRQQLLMQEARKIVLENEARQKQVAYSTLYNA